MKTISPNVIGKFFSHHCHLFLHQKYHIKGTLAPQESEFQRDVFEKGNQFENDCLQKLSYPCLDLESKERKVMLFPDFVNKLTKFCGENQTFPKYVHGPCLEMPLEFYKENGIPPIFSKFIPDFLEIREKTITVIDCKCSPHMKITHQIQVSIYVIFLEWLMRHHNAPFSLNEKEGIIWLPKQGFVSFSLLHLLPVLKKFLFSQLPSLLDQNQQSVDWFVGSHCVGCEYENGCKSRAKQEKKLFSVGPFSHLQLSSLKASIENGRLLENLKPTTDIEDLAILIQPSKVLSNEKIFSTLPHGAPYFQETIQATFEKPYSLMIQCAQIQQPVLKNRATVLISQNTEPVFLTVLRHPNGSIYGFGFFSQLSSFQGKFAKALPIQKVEPLHHFQDLEFLLINDLHFLIETLAKTEKCIQFFLYSKAENSLLSELLVRHACSGKGETAIKAQAIVRALLFDPDLVLPPDQPDLEGQAASAPACIVLEDLITSLFFLNHPGKPSLSEFLQLFTNCKPSNLTLESLYSEWIKESKQEIGTSSLQLYMKQIQTLFNEIKQKIPSNLLLGRVKEFKIKPSIPMQHPHLRRLVFMKQLEVFSTIASLQEERVTKSGKVVHLQFVEVKEKGSKMDPHKLVFKVCSGFEFCQPAEESFPKFPWILVRNNHFITSDMNFDDLPSAALLPFHLKAATLQEGHKGHLFYADIFDIQYETLNIIVGGLPTVGFSSKSGDRWILRERYIDWNVEKAISTLQELDCLETNVFSQLLENPVEFGNQSPLPLSEAMSSNIKVLQKTLSDKIQLVDFEHFKGLKLKRTQKKAFDYLVKHRLAIVHGPPGSGKTHSLALSTLLMLVLVRMSFKDPPPFKILMSAMTNAAIDEFLHKLSILFNLLKELKIDNELKISGLLEELVIQKLETGKGSPKKSTNSPSPKKIPISRLKYAVIAGTPWQIYKLKEKYKTPLSFDLVIIDEASQLLMCDACIPLSFVSQNSRILLAGDHLQLQPILHMNYPKLGENEPQLFGSVLDCVRRDQNNRSDLSLNTLAAHTTVLSENFRMVQDLAEYIEKLYPTKFEIFQKKLLPMEASSNESKPAIIELFKNMRSNGPHALHSIHFHMAKESNLATYDQFLQFEAKCVYDLMIAFKNGFGPKKFPNLKIFVVTPHRAQKNAIRMALAHDFNLTFSNPEEMILVDTVERMQGKECDIVLAMYSFFDLDRLNHELEFVFNLNRANVALSRARYFSLLLCTDAVLSPSLKVYSNLKTQEGFSFLKKFYDASHKSHWNFKIHSTQFETLKD